MSLQKFYFNTGVKYGVNPYLDKTATTLDAVGGGLVMGIPFYCNDVPKDAIFLHASDNPDSKSDKVIVREIHNSKLVSKYAHFLTK